MAAPEAPLFGGVDRVLRLSDQVTERILSAVLEGRLRPGDRLPSERELAEQFGVSRTVIREAVRSLTAKGILEVRSGRGLEVSTVDAARVRETMRLFVRGMEVFEYPKLHEVRAAIEVQVAGLAAIRSTPQEVQELRETCDRMAAVIDDIEAASREDMEFHRLLAISTRNELYLVILDAIRDPLLEIRRETFGPQGRAKDALASHRQILERVEQHDEPGARAAMRSHLIDVEKAWERLADEHAQRKESDVAP